MGGTFSKSLLSIYYVPDTVLERGDTVVNKTQNPCPKWRGQMKQK